MTNLFGVDVAIKKLRPNAKFGLHNQHFIIWDCPDNSEPPTWDEIKEQIQLDKKASLNNSTGE
tara:strand:- start:730 stop:918 length:189 start_codon:yes stop_codon:yes gene_type:complete